MAVPDDIKKQEQRAQAASLITPDIVQMLVADSRALDAEERDSRLF